MLNSAPVDFELMQVGLKSILFDQSLLYNYNIIEVGSDSRL